MGVDHPGGPGKGPETTDPVDKPTPPSTGGEPPAAPEGASRTPRMDSLRAAGWKFENPGDASSAPRGDDATRTSESSSTDSVGENQPPPDDPSGKVDQGTGEKTEAETGSQAVDREADPKTRTGETTGTGEKDQDPQKTEAGASHTAPGAESPRAQPVGEAGGTTGSTDAEPPSRPADNTTAGQDPTDRPTGGEAPPTPGATDQSSTTTDTGEPRPGEPANQDAPLTLDTDRPPAEAAGSGSEAGGERDGKPATPQTETTGDKPETTDKAEPGQPERTPYVDNPGSPNQPSRIASLIAAGWEFPGRTDATPQQTETTDPAQNTSTPDTDTPDPTPQPPESPAPSEQPQATDNSADTDAPPPLPEQIGEGTPGAAKVEGSAAEPPGEGELDPPTPGERPAPEAEPPLPESEEQPPAEPVEGSGTEQPEPDGKENPADRTGGEQDGEHGKTGEKPEEIKTGPNTLPYLGTYNPNGHFTQTVDQARRTSGESTQSRDTELPPWLSGTSEISQSATQDELDPTGADREPGVVAKASDRRKKSETDNESRTERARGATWKRGTDLKNASALSRDTVNGFLGPRPPTPTGHAETSTAPTMGSPHTYGATQDSFMAAATATMVIMEGGRKLAQKIRSR
ncbi:hypothetical protein GCM10023178_46900 [Actinomadura luteofluorescens]